MNKSFPKIMGILNVTPDSFSDGGDFFSIPEAVTHGLRLIDDGADIIDIGGESTRPGSLPISFETEAGRVIPVLKGIKQLRPDALISIDTTKEPVARMALENGATIINDISALEGSDLIARLAAEFSAGLILMHKKGTPGTMQENPVYDDVVGEIFNYLEDKILLAAKVGVKDIYADPGIGFGKTYNHNTQLLRNLDKFEKLNSKLVLGISRKRFIGTMLNINNPKDRDLATVLIHSILLRNKIDIIRVHNVGYLSALRKIFSELL